MKMINLWLTITYLAVLSAIHVYSQCVIQNKKLSCDRISELPRDLTDTSGDLQSVNEIIIQNTHPGKIKEQLVIQADAFHSTPKLQVLWIHNFSVKRLYKDTFANLSVIELFLHHDDIDRIDIGTFNNMEKVQKIHIDNNLLKTIVRERIANLPELVELTLSNNQIAYIDNTAFFNLPKLKYLELNDNQIDIIYVHQIINHLESLQSLSLHNNSLTVLTHFMLKGLTNLRVLNVGFNNILAIEPDTFEDTQKLQILMLNHNYLKKLDGVIFPKRGLNKMYLDNNNLVYLPTNFFSDLKDLKKITLVGNPWLCGCWDAIQWLMRKNKVEEKCRGVYKDRGRPVCVLENTRTPVCFYRYEFELNEKFELYKMNNPLDTPPEPCIL